MPEVAAGVYEVTTSGDKYNPAVGAARVLVGQTATVEFTLAEIGRATESVTVTAEQYDIRTPEVSTNVTPEQIKYLPQNSRNFLNFAALATGVSVTADFGKMGATPARCSARRDGCPRRERLHRRLVIRTTPEGGRSCRMGPREPFPQDSSRNSGPDAKLQGGYEKASAAISRDDKSGTNSCRQCFSFLKKPREGAKRNSRMRRRYNGISGRVWGRTDRARQALRIGSYEQNDQDPLQHGSILESAAATCRPFAA